ncbi:hypothetical protein NDU88_003683 [Pleurodeles waltl]|uniref:Uncharacterized protein n=1 Tax=Pleurodeles waltl TaxID=8319 RepID=A0AAV7UD93_PLEWA|nr:hypothetical protein NDU88_003683 [Pleurodeles waltl]
MQCRGLRIQVTNGKGGSRSAGVPGLGYFGLTMAILASQGAGTSGPAPSAVGAHSKGGGAKGRTRLGRLTPCAGAPQRATQGPSPPWASATSTLLCEGRGLHKRASTTSQGFSTRDTRRGPGLVRRPLAKRAAQERHPECPLRPEAAPAHLIRLRPEVVQSGCGPGPHTAGTVQITAVRSIRRRSSSIPVKTRRGSDGGVRWGHFSFAVAAPSFVPEAGSSSLRHQHRTRFPSFSFSPAAQHGVRSLGSPLLEAPSRLGEKPPYGDTRQGPGFFN